MAKKRARGAGRELTRAELKALERRSQSSASYPVSSAVAEAEVDESRGSRAVIRLDPTRRAPAPPEPRGRQRPDAQPGAGDGLHPGRPAPDDDPGGAHAGAPRHPGHLPPLVSSRFTVRGSQSGPRPYDSSTRQSLQSFDRNREL